MRKIIFLPLFFMLLGGVFGFPHILSAKTVYVKESGDDSNNGESSNPYKTLKKAAEEVNKGDADEVRIGGGSFDGGVTFEQGVNIHGDGKGSTTVTGPITFKKKADLKDLAVKTKSANALTLGKNATGNFKNIEVKDFTGVGIWITAGSAALTLEDSRIGSSSGKGIYAEAGSKLNVSGSTIAGNRQEGIDIRQNTRGTIKNNTIENNSESGIELIVGSSDFTITGNNIKKNGASGVAFQFYTLNKKFGEIVATNNTISGNRKKGIDCNTPSGGDTPAGYWADSISVENNTFSGNKDGDIANTCKLIEAKSEEEEKALEAKILEEAKIKAEEEEKARLELERANETAAQEEERKAREHAIASEVVQEAESVVQEDRYRELFAQISRRHPIQVFFRGYNKREIEDIRIKIYDDQLKLIEYQDQLWKLSVYQVDADLQKRLAAPQERLAQYQKEIEVLETKKGIFSSVKKEVLHRINRALYVLPI